MASNEVSQHQGLRSLGVMYITSYLGSYCTVNQVDLILVYPMLTVSVVCNCLLAKSAQDCDLRVRAKCVDDAWHLVVATVWGLGGISYMAGTNVALRHFTTN
jgi:hypothetical protein